MFSASTVHRELQIAALMIPRFYLMPLDQHEPSVHVDIGYIYHTNTLDKCT